MYRHDNHVTSTATEEVMATAIQVVFDTADPDREARFWAAALGYDVQSPPDGFATWEAFLRARSPRTGCTWT